MENNIRPSAGLGRMLARMELSTIESHRPSLFLSNRFMFDLRDFLMVLGSTGAFFLKMEIGGISGWDEWNGLLGGGGGGEYWVG